MHQQVQHTKLYFVIVFMFLVTPTVNSHYLPQLHTPIRLKEVKRFSVRYEINLCIQCTTIFQQSK